MVNQRNDEKGYKDTFEDFSVLPYSTDNRNLILNYGSFWQVIIISNSTFSWWVQYLSRNEDKIVIAPDRWSNIPEEKSFLLSDRFIKISV